MRTDESQTAAVLCGDLNMLRCFAQVPIPIVLASSNPRDVSFHSRYCRSGRVIGSAASQPRKALSDLLRIGRSFPQKPVLYYGDDAMLLVVSRNRKLLERYFRFLVPDEQLVEDLVNKVRFASLARRLDLPAPATVLSSKNLTARQVLCRLSLPCILKPNSHVGWFSSQLIREEGGQPQKVLHARTPMEFERLYEKMRSHGGGFVVQEYIPGAESHIHSFHAYLDQNSRMLGCYVGRKIRTYPQDAGISTYVELVYEPRVVELGREILQKLSFVGVVKIDFKLDLRRDRFYLLEINPRFNLWNYLGAACGVNLPLLAYRDLTGQSPQPQTTWKTGVRWLSFGDDMRAFLRDYRRSGELSWTGWLRSLMARKVHDVFSWRDPIPWFLLIARSIRQRCVKAVLGATGSLPPVPSPSNTGGQAASGTHLPSPAINPISTIEE